jgi:hypothetical protein
MTLAIRHSQQLELALSDVRLLRVLLGMGHQVPIPDFRGVRVPVLAEHDLADQRLRAKSLEPVTDPLRLELLTGSGEACLNARIRAPSCRTQEGERTWNSLPTYCTEAMR